MDQKGGLSGWKTGAVGRLTVRICWLHVVSDDAG